MKPRALFIFPPIHDFAVFDMYLKPFALLRLAQWFNEADYEVSFVNALDYTDTTSLERLGAPKRYPNGTGKFFRTCVEKPAVYSGVPRYFARYGILPEVLEARIRDAKPDIVFIGTGMTYWYRGVEEVVRTVKRIFSAVPVVLGGVYATLCTGHARAALGADYVVAGPASSGLVGVLGKLGLPLPRGAFPEEGLLLEQGFRDAAAIRLHSGCPLTCAYCASALVSGGFVGGNGERLFEYVRRIHEAFGVTHFSFYDDALLVNAKEGIIPFLAAVIARGLPLRFHVPNGMHIACITGEIARLLKQGGVIDFKLGYESAAEEFHVNHDNKYTRSMFEEAITALKAGGYAAEEIAVYVLAGLPRQYPGEVEASIRFAATFGIQVYVAEYSPIPHTALWDSCVAASSFPIAEEPLCQNNTIFPLQWEKFTPKHMQDLKQLARTLTRKP